MTWKIVRLELAETAGFPRGSASRAYLLRLPLDRDGSIDEAELRRNPDDAICRRFWSGERDALGYVVPAEGGSLLRLDSADGDERSTFCHLGDTPLIVGALVVMSFAAGERLPFRVARVSELVSA